METDRTPERWVLRGAMIANAAAIAIVNFWIYRALFVYGRNFPELVAERPVTISRAITDPEVSDLFSFWITVAAILLPFGVAVVAGIQARASVTGFGRAVAWSMVGFQLGSSVGMVLLSHYRFPDHDEVHMVGSYVFFISQTLMMISCGVSSGHILRHSPSLPERLRRANRLRILGVIGIVCLALLYLGLFVGKEHVSGGLYVVVYRIYTLTEPSLISSFLGVFAVYFIDLSYHLGQAEQR
ncbi:MAG: hypothetical protein GYB25_10720 [Rhodobacteraceae bacterium]|nr:hypothetical protein [Paracoccaceae bacterium]